MLSIYVAVQASVIWMRDTNYFYFVLCCRSWLACDVETEQTHFPVMVLLTMYRELWSELYYSLKTHLRFVNNRYCVYSYLSLRAVVGGMIERKFEDNRFLSRSRNLLFVQKNFPSSSDRSKHMHQIFLFSVITIEMSSWWGLNLTNRNTSSPPCN